MSTTKIEFDYKKTDFFQIVEEWAKENKFKLKQSTDNFRLYQKGSYLSWNAHPKITFELKEGKAVIECWINPIWGGRMEISSDNPIGVLAKNAARKPINKLLEKFNQKTVF